MQSAIYANNFPRNEGSYVFSNKETLAITQTVCINNKITLKITTFNIIFILIFPLWIDDLKTISKKEWFLVTITPPNIVLGRNK